MTDKTINELDKTDVTSKDSGGLQTLGLHPMVVFVMFTVDSMLFGGSVVTAGAAWIASIPVGILLAVGTTIIQQKKFNDDIMTAAAKGLFIGLLTAIPTPLPVLVTIPSGIAGIVKLRSNKS